jgi:hypothetical protein
MPLRRYGPQTTENTTEINVNATGKITILLIRDWCFQLFDEDDGMLIRSR